MPGGLSSKIFRLASRHASGKSSLDVQVVEIKRRGSWSTWFLVATAGCGGLYALHLKRQESLRLAEAREAAAKAEVALAQAEAEAKAEAAEAAKALAQAAAEAQRVAEEAEREAKAKRDAEAKFQAAKKAALEASSQQCAQFLSDIRVVEDAAEYYTTSDAQNEDLHALLANTQAFVDGQAFKDLQQAAGEKSQLANNLLSSLSFLRLFIERLQTAESNEQQFDAACTSIRSERRKWLAGEPSNLSLMQDALTRAEAAAYELQGLGMESDLLQEVLEVSRTNLKEMKEQSGCRRCFCGVLVVFFPFGCFSKRGHF